MQSRPFVGAAILTQQTDPSKFIGTTYCGGYLVTITLTAAAPIWPPRFEWSFYKDGITQWGSVMENQFPRTVDPYDTGELSIAASGTDGPQMIRAVALT